MLRYLFPLILVAAAVASFVLFTNPIYAQIKTLQAQEATYQDALAKSTVLVQSYTELVQKYNSITPDDLARLNEILPTSPDTVPLTLQIEHLAQAHAMALTSVTFNENDQNENTGAAKLPYQSLTVTFSTQSTYQNFTAFLADLEQNIRVVDFGAISFSVSNTATTNVQKYDVTITTYYAPVSAN